MLPKSHFRPLSRPRENGFVERSQNFVAASSMKSVHGLAKTRACEERYMADPSRSAGNLDPCRQGRQAELPAFGPRGCKRGGGGGNSRLCCRADCSRRRRQKPEGLSKAARIRLRSTQGNRRRQGRDGACDTLLIRRSSEFIKTFETSSLNRRSGALMPLPGDADQVRDRTPSNAWAIKIPAPTRPITVVSISNIANILCAPAHGQQNDAQARTVKSISRGGRTIGGDWGFGATGVPKRLSGCVRGAKATIDSPP